MKTARKSKTIKCNLAFVAVGIVAGLGSTIEPVRQLFGADVAAAVSIVSMLAGAVNIQLRRLTHEPLAGTPGEREAGRLR